MALYSNFRPSPRNNGIYLITSSSSMNFTYNGSRKWNMIIKILSISDPVCSIKVGSFKRCVKACLMKIQNMYDPQEWYDKNFELETAIQTKVREMYNNNYNFNFLLISRVLTEPRSTFLKFYHFFYRYDSYCIIS